ncbi:MAG: AAA family ATPase [Acidobacteriaceae bacterium]|nr:AAA family ATPase [Acidobacteriaceae bacterium]MBV9033460.1 AAA family ATPase [Acidobacteriaceae bacterium]MBV9676356.1 AAA family ATPase [Acidobacteriaceae bacterium]
MPSFPDFFGNTQTVQTLAQMIEKGRIPQTILLSGPEGVGKATLVRRFAAALLGDARKIERDDLSLPENIETVEAREKWAADKRADDPLLFSTHPDFVTFSPDGPLRQITIQQMRLLRERAQLKPLRGNHRVFLIDHLDRANEQSANSLLKVLEEPPEHLIIMATAENLYDLLPTIRSRSLVLQMPRLSDGEMQQFAQARKLPEAQTRVELAEGSPGLAVTLDLEQLRARRALILAALECAAGLTPFSTWVQQSESFSNSRSEKLEFYLKLAYGLLRDILSAWHGKPPVKNRDVAQRITIIAEAVSFSWIERAAAQVDELVLMVRRNIQKTAALDALIINLRNPSASLNT